MLLTSLLATALLAATATANYGGVSLYNNCNQRIYSNTVTEGWTGPLNWIEPKTWFWVPYSYPSKGGVSMKLRKSKALSGPITQLEYKHVNDGVTYYDLSNVDCGPTGQSSKGTCPFLSGGMLLRSDANWCPWRACKSGDKRCGEAYNLPKDDWATKACKMYDNNMVLYMCGRPKGWY
ncbi:hypothetical protein LTS18_013935 [Coniosporium uncinatum]|uniref:Uncharacterized protein n=1 Tax=Coniosporium uncinatum TaxID=93489 RepID=A0ACC3DVW3_9PEZI|nr:hypothetical protein LTS18_013935 [Coniosporium uncinatum]